MSVPSTDGSARLPNVGEVVAQRYRIKRFIARGGMSHVFEAQHVELGSTLALKVLDPGVARGLRSARLRFAREARLASKLKHPCIVEVFDIGETEAGLPFIAMELLDGDLLSQVMADRGPLPWGVARDLILQVLDALQVAHSAGAVHRDVKPDNCVVVPKTMRLKLLDFGIARVLHETQVTVAGSVMGTPHYLSPEQARGAQTDVRTDVYSAGVVLYEMLTGHCPFEEGTTFEIVGAHALEPPPPLSSRIDVSRLPTGLPELIERVLAKEADVRPPNAGSLAAEIRAIDRSPAQRARPGMWSAAAAAAFVVGISAVGVAKLLLRESSTLSASMGALAGVEAPRMPATQHTVDDEDEPVVVELEALDPPDVELEEDQPTSSIEPERVRRRRQPSRKLQVARTIRKAVSACAKFAPPAGAKVSLRAEVTAAGSMRGVQVRPPYAGSVLGRCVARVVGEASAGDGAEITFDQPVLVGG